MLVTTDVTRRLAAVLAADMVGYSRLIQLDETGTLARQRACMDELIRPKLTAFRGRLIKTTGDGVLVEFPSAVDAVMCAVAVQRAMPGREAGQPEDRRIAYRIGINLGEVIFEDGDIFGDGVNVAARLETLADPGGICISQTVFDTIKGKLELGFADLGARKVKNIAEPVPAFAVLMDDADAGKLVRARRPGRRLLALAAMLVAVAALAGAWFSLTRPAALPQVDQARLLVLPYRSGGSETDILAEAASENLWRTLGRVEGMTLVPRAAALALEGIEPTPQHLAGLGDFTHVLRGTVSKQDDGIVIDSALRQVAGDRQATIWDHRASGSGAEFFDRLNRQKSALVSAMNIALSPREREILNHVPTREAAAYVAYAKGTALLQDRGVWTDIRPALAHFDTARRLDPDFPDAMAGIAQANFVAWSNGWNNVRDNRDALRDALETAEAILARAPNHPEAMSIKIAVMVHQERQEEALELARGAVFRDNRAPVLRRALAYALMVNGDYDEAREVLARFVELAPRQTAYENGLLLWYYLRLDDLASAGAVIAEMQATGQDTSGLYASISEFLVRTGQVEQAQEIASGVLSVVPFLSLGWLQFQYRPFRDPAIYETYAAAMRAAGFPDQPFGFDQSHAGDRLSGAELTGLLAGGMTAVDATDPLGEPAELGYAADGTMRIHFTSLPTRPFHGTWEIREDRVCHRVLGIVLGHEYCDAFYRDPARWRDDAPRYIQLNAFGLFRFGVVPHGE